MSKIIKVTPSGFNIKKDLAVEAKKNQAKNGNTKDSRIEAKLDLIMEKLGISLD